MIIESNDPSKALKKAVEEGLLPEEMEEEISQLAEEIEKEKQRRQEALDIFAASLERKKDEAVLARQNTEQRWLSDLRQFNGIPLDSAPNKEYGTTEAEYRRTRDNITRPRVVSMAARLGDMLFPTNDRNWDLEASPKPSAPMWVKEEVAREVLAMKQAKADESGQYEQPTKAELQQALKEKVERSAASMRQCIDDQLQESSYADEGRRSIFDACLYGTGILKGPFIESVPKMEFDENGIHIAYMDELKPRVKWVDVWNFYPQPCRSFKECEHTFELHFMPRTSLQKLSRQPGFEAEAINRILGKEPVLGSLNTSAVNNRIRVDSSMENIANKYPVWEYHGPMPKESLMAFMSMLRDKESLDDDAWKECCELIEDDNLNEVMCEVWFCMGTVIKAIHKPIQHECPMYHVFNLEKNPDDWAGFGVAYRLRDDQQAADMTYHAVMLNTLMSAGPQVGVVKRLLEPMGPGQKSYDLSCTKPKVWAMNDEASDIKQALSVFNIPNVTQYILPVYERIKQNADEHIMSPPVVSGEESRPNMGASGMAMMMNAANVIMRMFAKNFDGDVTMPLIKGFYIWNMVFSDDRSIKGDYDVIPKGASHLLVKDIQAQHLQFLTAALAGNPETAIYIKWGNLVRKNVSLLNFHPDELVHSEEEVDKIRLAMAENQQPDPDMLKAQAQLQHAAARQQEAQSRLGIAERQAAATETRNELNYEAQMADLEFKREIAMLNAKVKEQELMIEMAKLDQGERLKMMELLERRERVAEIEANKKWRTAFEGRLKAQAIENQRRKDVPSE